MRKSGKRESKDRLVCLVLAIFWLGTMAGATEVGQAPVRMIVVGDRTGEHRQGVYGQIIEEVQRLRPDLVMTVGDQVEGYTDDVGRLDSEWAEYKQVISPLTMPIHLTPGNHDILTNAQEQVFRNQIGEPYYSFDYCGIHFVILDTGRWEKSEDLPAAQLAWLNDDLDQFQNSAHIIVFMHKPYWYNTTAKGKPDTLHTLFCSYGVDAVFTGHFHQYFTGTYNGIKYTGVGSSGAETVPGPTGLMYHYCYVTVGDDDIDIAPIKAGAVLPWDEVSANDMHLVDKIVTSSAVFDPLLIGADLRPSGRQVTLHVHNYAPDKEWDDTLRWEVPDNWTVNPPLTPIKLAPGAEQAIELQAVCTGSLYPVPMARIDCNFDAGKKAIVETPMRVARTIACTKAAMPPMIDGNIADPIWKYPQTKFFNNDGTPASGDPVAFYYAYDDNHLYVAAKCMEAVMDSLQASVVDHDGPIYTEDCIGLFIQPNLDLSTAYQIYINPLGYVFDQKLVINDNGYMEGDRNWDGEYEIKAIHGPDYWTVEAAIPLGQLGTVGKVGKKIGLNFRRKQARLGTAADWQVPIDYNPKTFGILKME
jgi:hypothetical protein